MEWLLGQKPSAVSVGKSRKELAKLAINTGEVSSGWGCFHEAPDQQQHWDAKQPHFWNIPVWGILLPRPRGTGVKPTAISCPSGCRKPRSGLSGRTPGISRCTSVRLSGFISDLIRRVGGRRHGNSRRTWKKREDEEDKERRSAGMKGEQGYQALPVTSAGAARSQSNSSCKPLLMSEEWGAGGRGTSRSGGRGQSGSCAVPRAGRQQQALYLGDRSGSVQKEQGAFLWTSWKLKFITPPPAPLWLRVSLLSPLHPPQEEQTAAFNSGTEPLWAHDPASGATEEDKKPRRRAACQISKKVGTGVEGGQKTGQPGRSGERCRSAVTAVALCSQIPSVVKRALCYC